MTLFARYDFKKVGKHILSLLEPEDDIIGSIVGRHILFSCSLSVQLGFAAGAATVRETAFGS